MDFSSLERNLFSECLHTAIQKVHSVPPHTVPQSYALLGAAVLASLTKDYDDFLPISGGFRIPTSPDLGDGLGPYYLARDMRLMPNGKPQLHHWIYRKSTDEYIDFTTRFFFNAALELEIPWQRSQLPSFFWGDPERLLLDYGIVYQPDEKASEKINSLWIKVRIPALAPDDFADAHRELIQEFTDRRIALTKKTSGAERLEKPDTN